MKQIDLPDEVDIDVQGPNVTVSGPEGEVERKLSYPGIKIVEEKGYVRIEAEKDKKELHSMEGTFAAHIDNMVQGVTEGFEYKLQVFYSHFPIQVKTQGDQVLIENFVGENEPRYIQILDGAEVETKGEEVIVKGPDKDAVGQTAANIEQITNIRGKDPRVFQDGVYIVEKP